jgi:hypothetical protein
VPLAGLCLLSPLALAAVPELALNLLSSTPTQTSIHFHTSPGGSAARRRGRPRREADHTLPAAAAALFAALVGNYL